MARMLLYLKAFLWRTIHRISMYCDLYISYPLPRRVSFTRTIPSTVGNSPGNFELLFYTPSDYQVRAESYNSKEAYPVVINFHGGGYTLGHAMDDGRWVTEVSQHISAVIVSVNYRLVLTYLFLTGIEDSVSAILWIWAHAEEFNLDISRTALTGFSAGANFTYTVPFRLQEELRRLKIEDKLEQAAVGNIVGLVSFYPSIDSTLTRAEREASNPNLISIAPKTVQKLFDDAYFFPGLDKKDPLVSHRSLLTSY